MRLLPALAPLVLLAGMSDTIANGHDDETLPQRDARLIDTALATMPAQRPGRPDLYVVGFAGDGHEDVFRNEVLYLETLANRRLGADGRVVSLVNHPDSLGAVQRPLATHDNLRRTLAAVGAAMDRDEDLLLLYVTTHGTEDHELVLELFPLVDDALDPISLRAALDEAGIRHRLLVISACYSGGFVPALRGPDTLVVTAARRDRSSFGCGSDSGVTWFGDAWLVEGLNRGTSPIAAYDHATQRVARLERADGYAPSLPQIDVGERIVERLQRWQAGLEPGPPVPYPYAVGGSEAVSGER